MANNEMANSGFRPKAIQKTVGEKIIGLSYQGFPRLPSYNSLSYNSLSYNLHHSEQSPKYPEALREAND